VKPRQGAAAAAAARMPCTSCCLWLLSDAGTSLTWHPSMCCCKVLLTTPFLSPLRANAHYHHSPAAVCHQMQGDALGRGQLFLHPAWLQLHTQDGQLLYVHRLSPHYISSNFYSAPIGGTCGGFLVDEMGLVRLCVAAHASCLPVCCVVHWGPIVTWVAGSSSCCCCCRHSHRS
jgi:hypothetical protein